MTAGYFYLNSLLILLVNSMSHGIDTYLIIKLASSSG